jgi:hypothetical protein
MQTPDCPVTSGLTKDEIAQLQIRLEVLRQVDSRATNAATDGHAATLQKARESTCNHDHGHAFQHCSSVSTDTLTGESSSSANWDRARPRARGDAQKYGATHRGTRRRLARTSLDRPATRMGHRSPELNAHREKGEGAKGNFKSRTVKAVWNGIASRLRSLGNWFARLLQG